MVKRYYVWIILLCAICFCSCADVREVSVEQESERWEITDIRLDGFPHDSDIVGVTAAGVYYEQVTTLDLEGGREYICYHFFSLAGEDTLIYQEEVRNNYRSFRVRGEDLLLATSFDEGVKVLLLSPDGGVKELFTQNAVQLPFIQSSEEYILSIRNNYNGHEEYENHLVLTDIASGEETTVYLAKIQQSQMTGEDIICISLGVDKVFFAVEEYDGNDHKYWLYTYSISEEEVVDQVSMERKALFAVGADDMVLLSETNDYSYLEEAGSIGEIVDGEYRELDKIPLISASNMISDSVYTGEGFFLSSYKSGYFWDLASNTVYVYDYEQIANRLWKVYTTEQGLLCLVEKEDGVYLRRINIR